MLNLNEPNVMLADGTLVRQTMYEMYVKAIQTKPRSIVSYIESLASGLYELVPHFFELDDVLILSGIEATEETIALLQCTLLEEGVLVVATWYSDRIHLHDGTTVDRALYESFWKKVRSLDYEQLLKVRMFAEAIRRGDADLWELQIAHLDIPRSEELDRLILGTGTNLDYPDSSSEVLREQVEIHHKPLLARPPAVMVTIHEAFDTLVQDVVVALRYMQLIRQLQVR